MIGAKYKYKDRIYEVIDIAIASGELKDYCTLIVLYRDVETWVIYARGKYDFERKFIQLTGAE